MWGQGQWWRRGRGVGTRGLWGAVPHCAMWCQAGPGRPRPGEARPMQAGTGWDRASASTHMHSRARVTDGVMPARQPAGRPAFMHVMLPTGRAGACRKAGRQDGEAGGGGRVAGRPAGKHVHTQAHSGPCLHAGSWQCRGWQPDRLMAGPWPAHGMASPWHGPWQACGRLAGSWGTWWAHGAHGGHTGELC